MKKFTNKKGFTIVELVIVIAVIAILAAVLIPTFNSVISKANESAALQKAQAALQVVTMEEGGDMSTATYYFIVDGKYGFKYDSTANAEGKNFYLDPALDTKAEIDAASGTGKTLDPATTPAYVGTNADLVSMDVDVYKVAHAS